MGDVALPGGRSHPGEVLRRGDAVVRPLGEGGWIEVLRRVNEVFEAAPRVVELSERTVSLEWLRGDAPQDLGQPPLSDEGTVMAVGALLRRLHDATAPIAAGSPEASGNGLADPAGANDVICHSDPLPGNVVFRDGLPVAFIDWEHAAAGRRAWDLAVALRWWSPLRAPQNLRAGEEDLDAAARARALLTGYGADLTLRGEAAGLLVESQRVAAANARRVMRERGEDTYLRWAAGGGERRLEIDKAWLSERSEALLAMLTR